MSTYELGFINVPVAPTFVGIAGKLNSQLIKPARDAGKKAAAEVERSVESTVKSLERQVSASTKKLGDLDRAYETSAGKRESQQAKLNAAIAEQTAAEEKYQAALKRGGSGTAEYAKLEKAKAKVTDETIKLAKAERDVLDAEKKHKNQLDDLRQTTEKYEKSQADLNTEVGKSKSVFGGIRESMGGMVDQITGMGGPIGNIGETLSSFKVGPVAGILAVAGAASTAGAAFGKWNEDLVQSRVTMQNQFGLSADAARDMQGEVAEALGSGLGNYEETSAAVLEISQTLGDEVAHMGGMTAAQLADDFMAFNQTFERSAAETASTVDVMLNSGLVSSAQEGIDLLTAGMQKVPAAMQDEVFDAVNEYSKHFANMGIDGAEAVSMLVDASSNGQYAIDKLGDAVKEYSVLAIDPAKAEAFAALGMDANYAARAVAEGGEEARKVLEATAQSLLDIEDPGQRAALAVELFGAPIEDLGVDQIPAFLESLTAGGAGMGEFSGSAQSMADNTARTFTGLMNSLKGKVQGWAIDTTLALNEWAGNVGSAIVNSNFVGGLVDTFTRAWDFIVTGLGWAKDAILAGWEAIVQPFQRAYERIAEPIGRAFTTAKDTVLTAWHELKSAFTGGDWGYGALASLIGADRAEWVVDKVSSLLPAWEELKAAIMGGDFGYGAMENLIGTDRAQWVLSQIDSVRAGFLDFRDRVVEGFGQVRDALAPAFEWLQGFVVGQLSGTFESLMGTLSSLWESIQAIGEALGGAFGAALDGLISAGQSLWNALKPVVELLINLLLPVFKVVGAIIGGVVVAAIMLFVGALRVGAEIIEFFAGIIQWLAEKVLSPLIRVLGEVVGFFNEHLAAAVGWVIQKFAELGNYLLENFWPALQTVMGWVGTAFTTVWEGLSWAWENIIRPVFDGIWQLAQVTLAVIGTLILAPLMIAWNLLTTAIQWAWENIIQPVWVAISTFATEVLWPALQSVFTWIGEKWAELSDLLGVVWAWIRDNVFDPLWRFLSETVWPAIESVLTWISDKFTWLKDMLVAAWEWLDENFIQRQIRGWQRIWDKVLEVAGWVVDKFNWVRDMLGLAWAWIHENVVERMIRGYGRIWDKVLEASDWIVGKWNWLRDKLGEGWSWIRDNVFGPIERGLDTVKGAFQIAVDGIRTIWDGLRAAAARPARFLLETVWNNGILKAWSAIAEFLPGIEPVAAVPLGDLGNYAAGGTLANGFTLPGYSPRVDNFEFIDPRTGLRIGLGGGESVMVPEWTQAVGGPAAVERMNRAARSGKMDPSQMQTGLAHAFANGGVWDLGNYYSGGVLITTAIQSAMRDIVKAKYPGLSLTSATRPGHSGYHGTGHATDWSNGSGNTPMQLALAHDIAQTYPGSAQLIYAAPGWAGNIYEGGPAGAMDSGIYKTAQAGRHDHHVHWAMTQTPNIQFGGGVFEGGSNGGGIGAAVVNWIADKARGIWSKIVDPINGVIDGMLGQWGNTPFAKIPGAGLSAVGDAAWSHLSSLFGRGGGSDSGSVDVSGITGPIVDQVEQVFARHGFTGADWDAAKWIIQRESNWNPQAVNPSSGAYGLFQFNPMGGDTLSAYLPDRNPNPAVQADAGARYMKDRYGSPSAAKAFWEANGWYADGGVVDFAKLLGATKFDVGGRWKSGTIGVNLSGEDEFVLKHSGMRSLGDLARAVGELVPAVKVQAESVARFADTAQEFLAQAADPRSEEGITARQSVRRLFDLGVDLPGAEVVSGFLDAEEALWASRARNLGHLDTLREKEEALEEARKALAELESDEGGLSKDEQRKLDDATKAVDEAKDNVAKAESEEKRASATEKLADAEEKLTRVREDLDESTAKSSEKRAEDITKANDDVAKAEQDLVEAKKAQAMDLDNITLVSQESIMGLIPQVEGLASQIIGMGAPVGMVSQGLGSVTGALASVAGMAGPAGITLGMAFDAVKIGIQLVKTIVGVVKEVIEKIRAARMAAFEAMADGWQVIADYAELVTEMQGNVAALQQEIVRGLNDQRVAEFNLRVAQQDRLVAEAEGVLAVAEARLALDREVERGNIAAQLRLMGLHEDWDTYLSFQALAANGMLTEWSNAAIGALFTYEAARAKALQAELAARVDQINAEADLARVTRQNTRNQADLLRAQERLIQMSAKVAGVDLVEATATSQVAKLVVEMAELQHKMDSNWLGKAGNFLGTGGPWSNEYRGQQAQMDSYRAALDAILKETGVSLSDSQITRAIDQMKWVSGTDGDPLAVLRTHMPELVAAETALKVDEVMAPIYDARDELTGLERDTEDAQADKELFDKVQPLEETIKGLDYTIKGLEQSAQAWAEGNEKLRGEYLWAAKANADAAKALGVDWQLDGKYATQTVRDQIQREITINWNGPGNEEEIQRMVDEILAGSNTRATVKKSASTVATARRGVGA